MRDALSILDKIVSFTNGQLDYANTLEHLNILDDDFYFKFLSCMQNQDLAASLLLYDDINRKGFEGDVLINGFSEFIRNLLVCKDQRAAALLEVVESFRDKYIQTAGTVSASMLIAALNILNDAEINYKASRNKRLHVELALIKLCYLQQAIELSGSEKLVAKKKLDSKPQAFRIAAIKSFCPQPRLDKPGREKEAKLIVEIPSLEKSFPAEQKSIVSDSPEEKNIPLKTGKLSALNKIRQQYQDNTKTGGMINLPLEMAGLQQAWMEYVGILKEAKNSAAQPFELAALRIRDTNSFEAVTSNAVERQFIEQNRNKLFSFLQEKLNNKLLQFNVIVEENAADKPAVEITLSSSQQYQKMIEMYPLIKELKEKLNLTLDY